MLGTRDSKPRRYIIDFQPRNSIFEVSKYQSTFEIIKTKVLLKMIENAEREKENYKDLKKKVNVRQNHLKKWWLFWRRREELINQLNKISRYIVCARVTKRPIFEFISTEIRPNDALAVFPLADDYSFGILQSSLHWEWFKSRCSTLKADYRYTSDTVFDTFPWPQWGILFPKSKPNKKEEEIKGQLALTVANASKELRHIRNTIKKESNLSLRDIYRTLELPGENQLKKAHNNLDKAVWEAYFYGLSKRMQKKNILEFLLNLNGICAEAEKEGKEIIGPGLPLFCRGNKEFYSEDCIRLF